jgi:membrane protein YdbS with pleckstrin-like domain
MMNIISKIAQKPSDKTIRITRILFALVLLLTIIFGWSVTRTEFGLPEYIKYILFIFPLIGLIRGIFDPGVFRKKIWKWTVF